MERETDRRVRGQTDRERQTGGERDSLGTEIM